VSDAKDVRQAPLPPGGGSGRFRLLAAPE
jgi:hypothetical protein